MPLLRRIGQMNTNKRNNFNGAAGPSTAGQRIHLRRMPTNQDIISQNLQNLQQHVVKKQIAQERYYNKGSTVGRSPLKRQPNANVNNNKMSIKNRLGNNTNVRQKVFVNRQRNSNTNNQRNPNNINQGNMMNRRVNQGNMMNQRVNQGNVRNQRVNQGNVRFQNVNQGNMRNPRMQNRNSLINNRNTKFVKRQSVQQRLTNIRNSGNNNTNQAGQKIRLRRSEPLNYTVQVKNHAGMKIKDKVAALDPKLQAEIKAIQSRKPALELVETPVVQAAFGCTTVTLNDRFTQLM